MSHRGLCILLLPIALAFSLAANSDEEFSSRFGLPVSASFGLGSLGNSDLGVPSRTMDAYSFEVLPSYRLGSWMIGPHFDYRIQEQLTSLSSAGGLNWRGKGYLIGLGARKDFEGRWFIQGSLDFIGKYSFSKQTSTSLDDHLFGPLGLRIKAGKAFFSSLPRLSFDADLQYLAYRNIQVGGVDSITTSQQFIAAVGLTCVVPCWSRRVEEPAPIAPIEKKEEPAAPVSSATPHSSPKEDLAKVLETKQVGNSLQLTLTGANFDVGSSELTDEGREKIAKVVQSLATATGKVRIEGHTDSSGNLERNMSLSKSRAESVKQVLVANGVLAERVSAEGFGPKKPIASNATKEGKAQNRRVEIFVDQEGSQK